MVKQIAFYVMRHGETTDNALGLISGAGSDPHLTDRGREQARAAGILFSKLPVAPAKIVTSSLRRTHQTAQLVAGHIEFIIDPDLNERHLGEHDGKISEAEQKAMDSLPGEESGADHAVRVVRALNRHLSEGEQALFICHGGTIRRILDRLDLKNKMTNVGNAEIYYLEPVAGGWIISAPGRG